MDLRGIANSVSSVVNPNTKVTLRPSTGFRMGPGAKQIPTYGTSVTGPAQIQALDYSDLKQIDGLNIQGEIRAIYLRGALAGVIRPDQKGGDLICFGFPIQTWLVVKVLESWPSWTKACIVRQGDGK